MEKNEPNVAIYTALAVKVNSYEAGINGTALKYMIYDSAI